MSALGNMIRLNRRDVLVAPSKRLTMPPVRMLVLTIADQGASSISNFALAILVAHYSHARALGIFALVTSTYIVAQGVVRAMTSNCLLTRPETDDLVMARYERAGYVSSLLLSLVAAAGVLCLTAVMAPGFTVPFVIFALSFPLMALQDYSRYVGISRHDPAYAIRLDVAWLVLFVAAYVVLRDARLVSMPWLFGAWTASGAVVGLYTIRAQLGGPVRELARFWAKSERAVGVRFVGQFLVASVSNYLIFYLLVLFVISVSAVGVIKLALLALGPVTVMSAGVQSAIIPMASKRFRHDRAWVLRFLVSVGVGMAAATALWTVLLYAAPVHGLTKLLGQTWPQARPLLPFGGLTLMMGCITGSATAGLQSLRAAKANLRVALAVMPVVIGLPVGGAAMAGAHGYVVAAAEAMTVYAVVAWTVLLKVSKSAASASPVDVEEAVVDVAEGAALLP